MKHLLILRGPSGAGKSTVAKILRNSMNGKTAVLCPDPFYHEISGKDMDREVIYGALYTLTEFYLKKGYNVILEGLMTSVKKNRMRLDRFIRLGKNRSAKVSLFFFITCIDDCMKRRERLGYMISKKDVKQMYEKSMSSRRDDEIEIDVRSKRPKTIAKQIMSKIKDKA